MKYLIKIEKILLNGKKEISWKIFRRNTSFYLWKKKMLLYGNVNFVSYKYNEIKYLKLKDLEEMPLYMLKIIMNYL